MSEALSPKQLLNEGQVGYKRGDYLSAAHAYEAAADGFRTMGEELAAAEALNNASVAYLQAGDSESAYRMVEPTVAVFTAAGDLRRQGMASGNLGAALESLGRLEEAIDAYHISADLLKQAGDRDMRAHVLQSLSALQLRTGRQMEALTTMQFGLEGMDQPTLAQRALKRLLQMPTILLNRS